MTVEVPPVEVRVETSFDFELTGVSAGCGVSCQCVTSLGSSRTGLRRGGGLQLQDSATIRI